MIHAVIADDEVLARQKLRQLLRDDSDIEIVGESATAVETIELVRAAGPELLFLDIHMPGMDGFDVVGALADQSAFSAPRVIFTTAYDQYAVRAFEVNAVDYLLKPFTRERLRSAVQRVREQYTAPQPNTGAANGNSSSVNLYTNRIVFKSRGRILFLPVSDIRWIGAEGNYVRLCTATETHLLRETMAHLQDRLDPKGFLRVHRSFIVNLKYVKEVRREPNGDSVVILDNGQKVAMGRSYRSSLGDRLQRS
ncbi:MAG TPA: LytTR family DNA-binding domain-containing protein [Terracidiphilus sp.]|nr:LytTR family DNA-binding domain-containing protein [Terracidiphilus sp.]